eukprot:COSAG06_NODE_2029_length_7797_cov_803.230969_2_plen_195_part_00
MTPHESWRPGCWQAPRRRGLISFPVEGGQRLSTGCSLSLALSLTGCLPAFALVLAHGQAAQRPRAEGPSPAPLRRPDPVERAGPGRRRSCFHPCERSPFAMRDRSRDGAESCVGSSRAAREKAWRRRDSAAAEVTASGGCARLRPRFAAVAPGEAEPNLRATHLSAISLAREKRRGPPLLGQGQMQLTGQYHDS